ALLETGGQGGPPSPALHLAAIIQQARTKSATYAATGLLDPTARNRLSVGVQEDKLTKLRDDLSKRNATLNTMLGAYDANLQQLASGIIQDFAITDHHQALGLQLAEKVETFTNLEKDLAGLRASLEADNAAFATYMQSYAKLKKIDGQ